MKVAAEIDGQVMIVDLEERDGRISASIDGRKHKVEVSRPEKDVYLIFSGRVVYEARVWEDGESNNMFRVKLKDRIFEARIIDRKHRRGHSDVSGDGRHNLTAPMPGKVVRVLLSPGQEVGSGQGVVVVEAMKMQNEIKSPKSGKVIEVRVAEGEAVSANQILAVVE